MESHAETIRLGLCANVGLQLSKTLKDAHDEFNAKLVREVDEYISRVFHAESSMAKFVCTLDRALLDNSASFSAVQELKKHVLADIETWKQQWRALRVKWHEEETNIEVLVDGAETFDIKENKRSLDGEEAMEGSPAAKVPRRM